MSSETQNTPKPKWSGTPAACEASRYFNSLPIEERRKLAPLLEEYRRLGMLEYAEKVRSCVRSMDMRMRDIDALQDKTVTL